VDAPLLKLQELFHLRDSLYREAAHHVVELNKPTIGAMVRKIIDILAAA